MPISATIVVTGPVAAVSTEQWRKRLQVKVIGQLAVTRSVLPRPRGSHGRVVFTLGADGRRFSPRRRVRMPAARG